MTTSPPPRVLIAEDFRDLTALYTHLINAEPDLEVAGTRETAAGLLDALAETRADLVLLDWSMPHAQSVLGQVAERARVIVVTGNSEPDVIERAFALGARGFVVKSVDDVNEILVALRTVAAGGIHRPRHT